MDTEKNSAVAKEPEATIVPLSEFLKLELDIPSFQRPYEWGREETLQLLGNMREAFKKRKTLKNSSDEEGEDFRYRLGTIILFEDEKGKLQIVDGQQRYITLGLLAQSAGVTELKAAKLSEEKSQNSHAAITKSEEGVNESQGAQDPTDKGSQKSSDALAQNKEVIDKWFGAQEQDIKTALTDELKGVSKLFEVVEVKIFDLSMAFQLFETQTTRGKRLCPHDELKAYHLADRADDNGGDETIKPLIDKWDARDGALKEKNGEKTSLSELFCEMLFKMVMWRRGESASFAPYVIENYAPEKKQFYGIKSDDRSPFAARAKAAEQHFQIGEPFEEGDDFFRFVEEYGQLYDDLSKWIEEKKIYEGLKGNYYKYNRLLFETALMLFADRFLGKDNIDKLNDGSDFKVVEVIFCWAFSLRDDVKSLFRQTANNYALGYSEGKNYANGIAMLRLIANAMSVDEISNIEIREYEKSAQTNDKTKVYIKKGSRSQEKREKIFGGRGKNE